MLTDNHSHSPRIDAAVFRSLEVWATKVLIHEIRGGGDDGVEADWLINGDVVRRVHDAWRSLTQHQRTRLCWRQIDRLTNEGVIEGFRSSKPGHNRSRIRYREVNPLDRIAAAL